MGQKFLQEATSCLALYNMGKKGTTVLGHSSHMFRRIWMVGAAFPNCRSQYLKEPE